MNYGNFDPAVHPFIACSTGQVLFRFTFQLEKDTSQNFYLQIDVAQIPPQNQYTSDNSHSTQADHRSESYLLIRKVFSQFYRQFVVTESNIRRRANAQCLKMFYKVICNQFIWQALRFHELMYLQLQFYSPNSDSAQDLNQFGLPKYLEFSQLTHTRQKELDVLLSSLRLRFWFPLDLCKFETVQLETGPKTSLVQFTIGFECASTNQSTFIKFFEAEIDQNQPLDWNIFGKNCGSLNSQSSPVIGQLMVNQEFQGYNCLMRIMRLAQLDIEQLRQIHQWQIKMGN